MKLRLGIEGEGTGVAYFEDAGMKEVPEVCTNNDFEDWAVAPTDSTFEFVAWTAEDNGGDVLVDTASPRMNGAAAVLTRAGGTDALRPPSSGIVKRVLGGGFDADPISNTILKQRINCLPCTEYEVTVFVKHNVATQGDYYGAFAIVGNITGAEVGGLETVYTGDFVELCNLGAGSSDWAAYTARYTSTEDWFEITLGLGATCAGTATFDAILIRDLTTRRYEYIYGLGRKLATLEYEGDVPEGQLYFDHHDLLGSPVMRTDIDGEVVWKGDYAPFGETLEEQPVTWGSQYKYMGNEDDGGLMDFGARFYDPLVGRFTSPDPIKDVSSANAVNPYVYCMNNPMRYTDKFGLAAAQAPIIKGGDEIGGGSGGGLGDADMRAQQKMNELEAWSEGWTHLTHGMGSGSDNPGGQAAQGAKNRMAGAAEGDALTGGFGNSSENSTRKRAWFGFYDKEAAGADKDALEHMQQWGEAQNPEITVGGDQYTEGNAGSLPSEVYLERMGGVLKSFTEQAGSMLDLFGMEGHGYTSPKGERGIGGYTYVKILEMVKPYLKSNATIVLFGCHDVSEQRKLTLAANQVFGKDRQIRVYIYGGNRFFSGPGDIYRKIANGF